MNGLYTFMNDFVSVCLQNELLIVNLLWPHHCMRLLCVVQSVPPI